MTPEEQRKVVLGYFAQKTFQLLTNDIKGLWRKYGFTAKTSPFEPRHLALLLQMEELGFITRRTLVETLELACKEALER